MRPARPTEATKSALSASISFAVRARGVCQSGAYGSAEGATVCHAPSSALSGLPPSAGGSVEPLRPAWPSCSPCFATPYFLQKSITRFIAASFSSLHIVAHFSEMRPAMFTLVASVMTSAPAPSENCPRCIKCQSFAEPFSELYWHMGDTTTRLGSVSPRSVTGEKSLLGMRTSLR